MNRTDDFSPQAAERQRLYADVDALAETVGERAADWDRDRQLDRQAFRDAAAIGLTGVEVPKYLGGLGLGFREKVTAAEILGRRSMAYAFSMINTHNVASRLAEHGAVSHKRELLPELLAGTRVGSTALTEPGAGSDFGAITTRAVRDGDGWVLNGEKAWITNATVSDVIICYAQTDPEAGSRGIASFLIDGTRPGFHRVTPYRLSGSHLIGTGGFRLEDYRAEPEDLLTEPGSGFRTALAGVNGARIYVAALCCAMVHASLVTATAYGAERQAFGQPLLKHQGLAWSLASVANKLEAGRLLTDRAIDLMDRDDGDEIILAAAHAKKFATEMAEPAIIACIQAMGAEGLRDRYPLGRHLADARVANFVDGSTEIQTERIARSLTRVYRHPTYEQPADVPDRRGHAVDRQTAAGPSTAGDGDQSEATQNSDGLSNPVATTIDPLPTTEPEQTTSARPAGGWFGESGEPSDEGSDEAAAVGPAGAGQEDGPPLPPDWLRTDQQAPSD